MPTYVSPGNKLRPLTDDEDEHDEFYQPRGKGRLRRCWDGLRASLGNVLMLTLIVLLFLNLHATSSAGGIGWPWSGDWVRHAYGRDERFMSLDQRYDALWHDVSDANTAIIHVEAGRDSYNGSIAMFHALHCLWSLRHALQRARAGEDIGVDQHDDKHWPHCFDYLRQAVLCAADDTIERAHLSNGTVVADTWHGGFIEGQLDVRECRDSAKLYEMKKLQAAE